MVTPLEKLFFHEAHAFAGVDHVHLEKTSSLGGERAKDLLPTPSDEPVQIAGSTGREVDVRADAPLGEVFC